MKIIVIGSKGQLGSSLKHIQIIKNISLDIEYLSKEDFDVMNFGNVKEYMILKKPRVVVNLSGFTDVDNAEIKEKSAKKLNHYAVENLAKVSKLINTTLIHISTDYVFNGNTNKSYIESDQTDPIGVYGKTKLDGEDSITNSDCQYVIIRTSWVFSSFGNNFLVSILKLISENKELNIVNDQIGCPTYANDISEVIFKFILEICKGKKFKEIYHYSGFEKASWYDFACEILKQKKQFEKNISCQIKPISSSEYITRAKRPKFSVLNCSKILKSSDVKLSNWRDAVKEVVTDLS